MLDIFIITLLLSFVGMRFYVKRQERYEIRDRRAYERHEYVKTFYTDPANIEIHTPNSVDEYFQIELLCRSIITRLERDLGRKFNINTEFELSAFSDSDNTFNVTSTMYIDQELMSTRIFSATRKEYIKRLTFKNNRHGVTLDIVYMKSPDTLIRYEMPHIDHVEIFLNSLSN